ncbi:hypothetical protein GF322_04160 [Candidatus Dependentiae bacterium]|nr:hypothetical protein [Candidatus Dependentiae bacterium]
MKKSIFVYFLYFILLQNNLYNQNINFQKSFILKGYIQTNKEWKNCPEFRFLYNGKETLNDDVGLFSFLSDNKINEYSILICKNIYPNFANTNTIDNFTIKLEKPSKLYSFQKDTNDQGEIVWQQQKEKIHENKNFTVPPNCIIALINPKYVDDVKSWKEVKLSNNLISGPKIILKENIDIQKVKREAAKSLLRSLDIVIFHEKIRTAKRDFTKKNNVKVYLAQNK